MTNEYYFPDAIKITFDYLCSDVSFKSVFTAQLDQSNNQSRMISHHAGIQLSSPLSQPALEVQIHRKPLEAHQVSQVKLRAFCHVHKGTVKSIHLIVCLVHLSLFIWLTQRHFPGLTSIVINEHNLTDKPVVCCTLNKTHQKKLEQRFSNSQTERNSINLV